MYTHKELEEFTLWHQLHNISECCHSCVEKQANGKTPGLYNGVNLRNMTTIMDILETMSRTTPSPTFLLISYVRVE